MSRFWAAADVTRQHGPAYCSTTWQVANAFGTQRIYAVIDPNHTISEVHEEGDTIDNNTGYNLLYAGESDYVEPAAPGEANKFQVINYQAAPGQNGYDLGFSLYAPSNQSAENMRYQLLPAGGPPWAGVVGKPLQVVVSQAGATGELEPVTPLPFDAQNPAILVASYRDSDLRPGAVSTGNA